MIDLTVSDGSGRGFCAMLLKQRKDRAMSNEIAFNIIAVTD
jgi:hypothetical protein